MRCWLDRLRFNVVSSDVPVLQWHPPREESSRYWYVESAPRPAIYSYSDCSPGGSTSVGRMAIQIAKLSGGYVVASCSKASEAGIRELGPDEVCFFHLKFLCPMTIPYRSWITIHLPSISNLSPNTLPLHLTLSLTLPASTLTYIHPLRPT